MAWHAEMESDRDVLKRIVALLFALAELADSASTRSYSVRCEVLGILRFALTVALQSVTGTARDLGGSTPPQACLAISASMFADAGDDAEDAMLLARRLRALALALAYLLVQAGCFALQWTNPRMMTQPFRLALQSIRRLVPLVQRPALIDTS